MATTSVIFPNTINVVLNDTLSSFISTTTVSPTVAGTFVFNLNNSSGAVLTASSVFDAVGNFTIYSSFTPTDSVTYQASSATVIVTVQDNDAYNNYFNIPVTDLSNILVNGDFNYIPSSIASGTSAICPPNVPGWRFFKYTSYPAVVNNIDLSSNGITSLPYPFGTKCVQFVGGYMSQPVFCIAGSYTLSAYIAAKPVATSAKYLQVWINNVSITTSNAQYPTLNNWQQLSVHPLKRTFETTFQIEFPDRRLHTRRIAECTEEIVRRQTGEPLTIHRIALPKDKLAGKKRKDGVTDPCCFTFFAEFFVFAAHARIMHNLIQVAQSFACVPS